MAVDVPVDFCGSEDPWKSLFSSRGLAGLAVFSQAQRHFLGAKADVFSNFSSLKLRYLFSPLLLAGMLRVPYPLQLGF